MWNTIYRYIYNLYLLILAINITVKFTIHLEHTRKASFFTPALVVWSRLNISFQKICINLHRPYTVHKLWKGLFFSASRSLQFPKYRKTTWQQSIMYSFLRSFFFIHQCLIQEKQIWLQFKSIHSSLQYLRWWTHGSQEGNFSSDTALLKIKICETAMSRRRSSLTLPHGIKCISPLQINSYCELFQVFFIQLCASIQGFLLGF